NLSSLMTKRQTKARHYLDQVRARTGFMTLPWPDGVVHTFKDLTVLVPDRLAAKRDDVISWLKHKGIETRAYFYPPVHEQQFFRPYADRSLPLTEKLSRRVITLPFFSTITEAEIDCVVDSLAEAERSLA